MFKYIALQPFYPVGEYALYDAAQGYTRMPGAPELNKSARNSKQMTQIGTTWDLASTQSAWTFDNTAASTPAQNFRETQNAGNIPSQSGIGNVAAGIARFFK